RHQAAVAKLALDAETTVAEQGAGIVAASDGVISGGEFLEAEQRIGGILPADAKRERQLGHRPEFPKRLHPEDGGGRIAFEAARRYRTRAGAACKSRSTSLGRAEDREALTQLEAAGHPPAR